MKTTHISRIALSLALLAFTSAVALADGMPIPPKKAEPILTPIDQTLTTEQAPGPMPEPQPITPAPEAKAEPAPVPVPDVPAPAERIVETQDNSSFLGLSLGMYSGLSHVGARAPSFGVEWRPGVKLAGVLQPLFGAFATTKGAYMGYGGLGVPVKLANHLMLLPSLSVGAYEEGSDGYDLGHRIAYRFGTELAYIFDSQSRVSLNAHVISNGTSLSRDDRTEVIGLSYTTPIDFLSGHSDTTTASAQ